MSLLNVEYADWVPERWRKILDEATAVTMFVPPPPPPPPPMESQDDVPFEIRP